MAVNPTPREWSDTLTNDDTQHLRSQLQHWATPVSGMTPRRHQRMT